MTSTAAGGTPPRRVAVTLRLYAELNDFVPTARRGADLCRRVDERTAVKDVIEAAGVPHPEVDLVIIDGTSVGFEHQIYGGERIAAYPPFTALDVAADSRVRPRTTVPLRFLCDGHLAALARRLRLLGFDTWHHTDAADADLAQRSTAEDRVLLTRDRGLLKRRVVARGYCVRQDDPDEQLIEVARRYRLAAFARPFSRCLACNGMLRLVGKHTVAARLPPAVRREQDRIAECGTCRQLYWPGSHTGHLTSLVERVEASVAPPPMGGREKAHEAGGPTS